MRIFWILQIGQTYAIVNRDEVIEKRGMRHKQWVMTQGYLVLSIFQNRDLLNVSTQVGRYGFLTNAEYHTGNA